MILPLLIAGIAAAAILLIFFGLVGGRSVDPVQARLTQLGTMQAKNLEELELQQPFLERTLRPLAGRLSGTVGRVTSQSFSDRTEKRLALAGNPGDLGVTDWLGIKGICTIVFAILFFLLFLAIMGWGIIGRHPRGGRRRPRRLRRPGVLARPADPGAPEGDPAHDPGHARPADDLGPGRARLRRRARQGRREAQGPAVGRVPPGARRGPRRQVAPRGAARHRSRAPRSRR